MSDVLHQYSVTVHRVVDGDTLEVDIDLGFNVILQRKKVRLKGVDTPELSTEAGQKAKTYVSDWVFYKKQVRSPFILRVEDHKEDKYGRILGVVWSSGEDLVQQLILRGYGKPYDGGKKDLPEPEKT